MRDSAPTGRRDDPGTVGDIAMKVAAALACGLFLAAAPASAQDYPPRTIRVLVSSAPGGLLDLLPRDRFLVQGAELPLGTPEDFAAFIDAEYRKWGPVVTKANIRIN